MNDDASDERTGDHVTLRGAQSRCSESSPELRQSGYAWPKPGVTLADRFRFSKLLGSGGNGEVWEALNIQLRVKVAIKLPNTDKLNPEDLERFRREARALCLIHNEHVLRFFEYNTEPTPYLVMELLRGHNLAEHIEKNGPLPLSLAKTLCRQICAGLHAVHDAGIIHRDIKPSNIYCQGNPGKLKLVDFGLMKLVSDAGEGSPDSDSDPKRNQEELTRTGMVLGTPQYMSPEQWSLMDQVISFQSDLWSLAVVLYKVLTGETPFKGKTHLSLARSIMYAPAPEATKVRNDLPPGVDEFFQIALHKDPGRRFTSALEMGEAFDAIPELPLEYAVEQGDMASPAPSVGGDVGPPKESTLSRNDDSVPTETSPRSRARRARVVAAAALSAIGIVAVPIVVRTSPEPGPCPAGKLDCDKEADNGCETDIAGIQNCGGCGVACVNEHGSTACAAGGCAPVCEGGFADCDGNHANGCEADLQASAEHCGGCGHACGERGSGAICAEGACVLAVGGSGCAALAVDAEPDGNVYWTNPSARVVQMASKRGGPARTLWNGGAVESIAAGHEHVYWIDTATTNVMRYRKNGGAVDIAVKFNCDNEVCASLGLAASGAHAYYVIRNKANPFEAPILWRSDKRAPVLQDKSLAIVPGGLAADARGVSWLSVSGPQTALWRLDSAAPQAPKKMLDLAGKPGALAADPSGAFVVWSELGSRGSGLKDGAVRWAAASPLHAARQDTVSEQREPRSVAVDPEWVYWSTADGEVKKARSDGAGAPVLVASDSGVAASIAVDERYLFWISAGTGMIKRASK